MPGVRNAGEKEVRQNLELSKFAQVDSVLSADGRRPVRHAKYTPNNATRDPAPVPV